MSTKNIVGLTARIVVGLVFIVSAVTKYISIEAFDLFVYEHQIFSWEITGFVTRLLIATEAFLGIMLLSGVYSKQIKLLSVLILVLFTIYILLKPLLFNVDTENCHCFGTVLLLNDTQTLIKNIVLLAVSYFMFWDKGACDLTYKVVHRKLKNGDVIERNKKTFNGTLYSKRKGITVVLFIVLLLVANTVTPAEPVARKIFPKTASIDRNKFDLLIGTQSLDVISDKDTILLPLYQAANDSIKKLHVTEGKKILCLYSTGCKYCKRTAKRLDVVRQRYDIADSSMVIVFWGGLNKIDSFFVKTQTKVLPHTLVRPAVFLPATKGKQPVVVLMNGGKPEKLLKYPNINEKEISEFFNSERK